MEQLRSLRKEHSWKQKDVADMLGIHVTTYTKYETGGSEPNHEMLLKLADIFSVSIDYLLGRTDQREKLPAENEELSSAEVELVNAYRDAPANVQAAIRTLLERK